MIDTAAKRASALLDAGGMLSPDGTIDDADRETLLGVYGGIPANPPTPPAPAPALMGGEGADPWKNEPRQYQSRIRCFLQWPLVAAATEFLPVIYRRSAHAIIPVRHAKGRAGAAALLISPTEKSATAQGVVTAPNPTCATALDVEPWLVHAKGNVAGPLTKVKTRFRDRLREEQEELSILGLSEF